MPKLKEIIPAGDPNDPLNYDFNELTPSRLKAKLGKILAADRRGHGRPQEYFHGTRAAFDKLDPNMVHERDISGRGHFFDPSPKIAAEYSHLNSPGANIRKVFLDTKNTLDWRAKPSSRDAAKILDELEPSIFSDENTVQRFNEAKSRLIKDTPNTWDKLFSEIDKLNETDGYLSNLETPGFFVKGTGQNPSDPEGVTDLLKKLGYDSATGTRKGFDMDATQKIIFEADQEIPFWRKAAEMRRAQVPFIQEAPRLPGLKQAAKDTLPEIATGALKSLGPAAALYSIYDMATGGDPLGSEIAGSEEEDLYAAERRGEAMFMDALKKRAEALRNQHE